MYNVVCPSEEKARQLRFRSDAECKCSQNLSLSLRSVSTMYACAITDDVNVVPGRAGALFAYRPLRFARVVFLRNFVTVGDGQTLHIHILVYPFL